MDWENNIWMKASKCRSDYIDYIENHYKDFSDDDVVDLQTLRVVKSKGKVTSRKYRPSRNFGTLTTYYCKEVQDAYKEEKKKLLKSWRKKVSKYPRVPKYKKKKFLKCSKKNSRKKDAHKQEKHLSYSFEKPSKYSNKKSKKESPERSSIETDDEHSSSDSSETDEAKMKKVFMERSANSAYSMLTIDSLSLSKNYSPKATEAPNPVFSKNVSLRNEKSWKRVTLFSTARKSQILNSDMAVENFSNEKVSQSRKEQNNVFHSSSSDILNVPDQLNILHTKSQNKKREKVSNEEKNDNIVAVNFDQNNLPSQCKNVSGHVDSLKGQTPILLSKSKKGKKRAISDLDSSVNKKTKKTVLTAEFQKLYDDMPTYNLSRENYTQGEKKQNNYVTNKKSNKKTTVKLNDHEKRKISSCHAEVLKAHSSKQNKKLSNKESVHLNDKLSKTGKLLLQTDSDRATGEYSDNNNVRTRNKHLISTRKLTKNKKIGVNFNQIDALSHCENADEVFDQVDIEQTAESLLKNKKGWKQAPSALDYPINKKSLNEKFVLNACQSKTLCEDIPLNENLAPNQKHKIHNSRIVSKNILNKNNKTVLTERKLSLRSAHTFVNNNSVTGDFHQSISQSCKGTIEISDDDWELFVMTYGKFAETNHGSKQKALLNNQKDLHSYNESYEVRHTVVNSSETFTEKISDQENMPNAENYLEADKNTSETFGIEKISNQEHIYNSENDIEHENISKAFLIEKNTDQENIPNAGSDLDAEENTSGTLIFDKIFYQENIYNSENDINEEENSSETFIEKISSQENIPNAENLDDGEHTSNTFIIEENSDQENIYNSENYTVVDKNTSETFGIEKISNQEHIYNSENDIEHENFSETVIIKKNSDQENIPDAGNDLDVDENTLNKINEYPCISFKKLNTSLDEHRFGTKVRKSKRRDFSPKNKLMLETFLEKMNQRNFHDKIDKFDSAEDQSLNRRLMFSSKDSILSDSEVTNTHHSSSSSLDSTICLGNNHCFDNMKCNNQNVSHIENCCADNLFSSDLNLKNTNSICETENDKGMNKKVEHSDVPNVLAFKISCDLKQKSKKRVLNGVKSAPHDNQVNISKISSLIPKHSNPSLETRSVKSKKQSSSCHEVYESNYSTSISKGSKDNLKNCKKPSLSSSKKYSKESFSNYDPRCKIPQIFKCNINSKVSNQGKISGAERLRNSEVFIDKAEHSSEASDNNFQSKTVHKTSPSLDLLRQLEEDTILALSKTNCKKSKSRSCSQNFNGDLIQKNYLSTSKSCKKHKKYRDNSKNVSSKSKSLSSCVERHTEKRVNKSLHHKKGNSESKAKKKSSNKTSNQKNIFDLKNISIDFLSLSPYVPKGQSKKQKEAELEIFD